MDANANTSTPEIRLVVGKPTSPNTVVRRKVNSAATIDLKAFWSVFGSSLSLLIAVVPTLLGVEWWITSLSVVVASTLVSFVAHSVVHNADCFRHLKFSQKQTALSSVRMAVWVFAVWTLLFVIRPELWIWWALLLPLVCLGIYWAARGVEYRISHKPTATAEEEKPDANAGNTEMIDRCKRILKGAGHPQVKVLEHKTTLDESGSVINNQFVLQTPPTGR